MSRLRIVKMVLALQEKPHTNAQLQAVCGFTRDNVRLALNDLREQGYADVMGWAPSGDRGGAPVLWGWKR